MNPKLLLHLIHPLMIPYQLLPQILPMLLQNIIMKFLQSLLLQEILRDVVNSELIHFKHFFCYTQLKLLVRVVVEVVYRGSAFRVSSGVFCHSCLPDSEFVVDLGLIEV